MVVWCRRFGVFSLVVVGCVLNAGQAHADSSKPFPAPTPLTSPLASKPNPGLVATLGPADKSSAPVATFTSQASRSDPKTPDQTVASGTQPSNPILQPVANSHVSGTVADSPAEPSSDIPSVPPDTVAAEALAPEAGKGSGPVAAQTLAVTPIPPSNPATLAHGMAPGMAPAASVLVSAVQAVADAVQTVATVAVALSSAPVTQALAATPVASVAVAPLPSLIIPPAIVTSAKYYHGLYPAGVVVSPWFLAFGLSLVLLGFAIIIVPALRAGARRLYVLMPRFVSAGRTV